MPLNRTFPDIASFAQAVTTEIQNEARREVQAAMVPVLQELAQLRVAVSDLGSALPLPPPPAPPAPPPAPAEPPPQISKPLPYRPHPLASERDLIRQVKIFQYLDPVGTNSIPGPEQLMFVAAVNEGWVALDADGLESLLAWIFVGSSARLAAGLGEFETWYIDYKTIQQ